MAAQFRVGLAVVVLLLLTALLARAQTPTSRTSADATLPDQIPLFPLQDAMLFPDVSRPLHIFESRYQKMVADALKGDRMIGMVMLKPGHEAEYAGQPPIYSVGMAGVITDVNMYSDGRYDIALRGLVRFRVLGEDQSRPYRLAQIEVWPDRLEDGDLDELAELRARLVEILGQRAIGTDTPPTSLSDIDLVNLLSQFLPMEPSERQILLECEGSLERARALIALLGVTADDPCDPSWR